MKSTTINIQQWESKTHNNTYSIIEKLKSGEWIFDNTKLKPKKINAQQYKSKKHTNDRSIIQY